jgi:hypothetical protein
MRTYILIALVALWARTVSLATPFSDSAGSPPANPGVYGEQNQLHIYASPSTNSATGVPQDGLGMSTESDWTVSVDVRGSAPAASSDMISLGAYPLNTVDQEAAGLALHLNSDGSESMGSGVSAFPELMLTNGTVRVSYTATDQELEIAYSNASTNLFQPLLTRNTSNWPAMKSSGFVILLDAETAGEERAPGDAFLDNLTVSLGTSPAWEGNRLPDGSMDLSSTGGIYQVQGSTNAFDTANAPPSIR